MNRDTAEGKFKQLKGKIKAQWGKLTDDEIDQAEGNLDDLAGKIQEKYGKSREAAKKEVEDFRRQHQA